MRREKPSREPNPESGLTIRLFGGMAIQDSSGVDYLPRSRKTRAIMAVLTLTAPRSAQRGQLTGLLWSQRGTAQGRASLRQAVHEMQWTLGSAWNRILLAERHCLSIDLHGVAVDALEAIGATTRKTELLTLFEDGFLEDLGGLDPAFDIWLSKKRRRMMAIARTGGEAFLEEGHPREATILAARSLLRLDPGNDGAWRALIEAHIEAGDRAAARFACEQWGEAMGLAPEAAPPAEMAAFLSQIRFGSDYRPPGARRTGVMQDVTLPAGPMSNRAIPNRVLPNGIMSDRVVRDVVSPGRVMPDGTVPDQAILVRALSDRGAPDRAEPDGLMEDVAVPERTIPGVTPDGTSPNGAMPGRVMPDGTVPAGAAGAGFIEGAVPPESAMRDGATPDRGMPDEIGGRTAAATGWNTATAPWIGAEPGRSSLRLGIREMRVIGADVDQALSAGLAEEVTTALSRFRWISCVSGSSLAAIAGETRDINLHWPELDLDLLLDGTIQRGGDRVRITVRLLDMRGGEAVIWANRFDHDASDTLTVQDRVAAAIVAQVDPMLLIREGERAAARTPRGVSPRDLVLQAVPAIYRMDRLSFHAAGELLEAALRSDPTHTDALAWYAYWHLFLVGQGWADDPDAATRRAGNLADAAVAMDPNDARALTLAGHVRGFLLRRPDEAAVLHERAISLNPNLAIAWCFSGFTFSYLGDHKTALARMAQAIELSPSDPHLFFFQAAIIMPHLLLGEYEEAAAAGRKAIELNPWYSSSFKGCLAALGHLGHAKEAAGVMSRLLKLEPSFSVRDAVARSPMSLTADVERYADGLRQAGLQEW